MGGQWRVTMIMYITTGVLRAMKCISQVQKWKNALTSLTGWSSLVTVNTDAVHQVTQLLNAQTAQVHTQQGWCQL